MAQGESSVSFNDNGDDSITSIFSRDQAAYFAVEPQTTQICSDLTMFDTYKMMNSEEDTITIPDDSVPFVRNLENSFHLASTSSSNKVPPDCKLNNDAKLWHLKLGHLPFRQLSHVIPGLNVRDWNDDIYIWGPFKHKTHNSCTMLLTIVDDFTRHTWVHLLNFKNDSVKILIDFVIFAENQHGFKVKCIRSDNAKELCECKIADFYLAKDILHQISCSDTPQQNGVVERKHKHLLETAIALFFQSKVPYRYWGECVLSAAHIINRMPLSVLHNLSPCQKLFGTIPDISHLRAFGCLCFVTTSKVGRTKFDPRADPCVFIGYSPTQKGYRVLHLNNNHITVSKDVHFYEQHFPFHVLQSDKHPFQFFLPNDNNNHIFIDPFVDYTKGYHAPISTQIPVSISSDTSSSSTSQSSFSSPNIPYPLSMSISDSNTSTNSSSLPYHIIQPSEVTDILDTLHSGTVPDTRHSTRQREPPKWMKDYMCKFLAKANPHWCNLIFYFDIPSTHKALIAQSSSNYEPNTYK
ncbi:uncharacterized protein LOC110727034 [Chenopodium quinoa]|uniref:uncharacterized protein LOC110727034 n=1 Tax=Chenopodium quinoa TaxID=63459 RepID=UPI000B790605|nr:uncharacterized protein LOC110727034 [Chenopodium quinoa]